MPTERANILDKRAITATADSTSYPAFLIAEFLAIFGFAGGLLLTTALGVGIFSRSSRAGKGRMGT
jgi:hypothetical protein